MSALEGVSLEAVLSLSVENQMKRMCKFILEKNIINIKRKKISEECIFKQLCIITSGESPESFSYYILLAVWKKRTTGPKC